MNELYIIHDGTKIIRTTVEPQTDGLFCVCDINDYANKKFVDGNLVNLTTNEKKAIALANYESLRIAEYGSLSDQLDEIYKDINAWKTRIAAIKLKYPKP